MATMNSRDERFRVDDVDLSLEDVEGIDWAERTQSAESFQLLHRVRAEWENADGLTMFDESMHCHVLVVRQDGRTKAPLIAPRAVLARSWRVRVAGRGQRAQSTL